MHTTLSEPLHIACINAVEVRLFAPPTDKMPALPWTAFHDAAASIGVSTERSERFMRSVQDHPQFKGCMRSVPTEAGIVLAVSKSIVFGLSEAVLSRRKAQVWTNAWARAAMPALNVLTKGLSEMEAFQFVMTANRNG